MKQIDLKKVVYICERNGLIKPSRKRETVYARAAAFNFIRQNTELSLTAIGELFNKDHATVLHALKVYYYFVKEKDEIFLWNIRSIEAQLNNCEKVTIVYTKRPLPSIRRTNNFRSARVKVKSFNYEDNN
jgi:hypothetical protein